MAPLEINAGTCWEQEYSRPKNDLSVEKAPKSDLYLYLLMQNHAMDHTANLPYKRCSVNSCWVVDCGLLAPWILSGTIIICVWMLKYRVHKYLKIVFKEKLLIFSDYLHHIKKILSEGVCDACWKGGRCHFETLWTKVRWSSGEKLTPNYLQIKLLWLLVCSGTR